MNTQKALVLLSGGQDSTTCLFWALDRYGEGNVHAIGFDYNQRHVAELSIAKCICDEYHVPWTVVSLPAIGALTNNALTNPEKTVDNNKPEGAPPNTLVEGRNLLFLTYAAIYAKTLNIHVLVIGASQTDYSGYPDCRNVFMKSTNVTLNLSMDYEYDIQTPLMWCDKSQVWQLSETLGVIDIIKTRTLTCYNGIVGDGCGACPACDLRSKGYQEYLKQAANRVCT